VAVGGDADGLSGFLKTAHDLRFLVFDELHTYRGRQGADVALLARRARLACGGPHLQIVGTSATMGSEGSPIHQRAEVARVATLMFGTPVGHHQVIDETLRRSTAVTLLRNALSARPPARAHSGPVKWVGRRCYTPCERMST
jgi:hypothetical protein